jgi:hypothetical protein
MAVAIIFGLLLSTLLTLGVVPTLYLIYSRIITRLGRKALSKERGIAT